MEKQPHAPLNDWVSQKTGAPASTGRLQAYQLEALNRTLLHVQTHSTFYRQLYADFPMRPLLGYTKDRLLQLKDLGQLPLLPTIEETQLRENGPQLLCTSQKQVHRIVTLQTSGTTQDPKRLYFTRNDLLSTVDFFSYGLQNIAPKGVPACILFPATRPDSVGDILLQSYQKIDTPAFAIPPTQDVEQTLAHIQEMGGRVLLGHPVQILALGRYGKYKNGALPPMDGVLISGDRSSGLLKQCIQKLWNCPVYPHYGLTETAYGGAVSCGEEGQHIREADLLVEILHPDTQTPLPEGDTGEIVLSTLGREAMPLLRYRTGDLGRLIVGACSCGCILRRLDNRIERINRVQSLGFDPVFAQRQLDERLFLLPQVANFQCTLSGEGKNLALTVQAVAPLAAEEVADCLKGLSLFKDRLPTVSIEPFHALPANTKRKLQYQNLV